MASTPAHTATTAEAVAEAAGRRAVGPLRRALATVVCSRLVIFAVAFAAAALIGAHGLPWAWRFPAGAEVFHGTLGHFLNPWANWDGVWYIKIAKNGYADADGSTAFFPLYPVLLRYVGVIFGGNLVVTGIAISLACYGGAVWMLDRLVRAEFGDSVAARAVLYLSIGPLSFFFQAVYTESLFLFLSLACFVCAREGRWRLAGLTGLLATLTRSTGVLLLVPMVVFYYEQRDWKLRRTDKQIVNLLMIPEGLLVWMTYLSLAFGKPLLFAGAQAQWQRGLAAPNYSVARGALAAAQGLRQLISDQYLKLFWEVPKPSSAFSVAGTNLINIAFLVLAGLLLLYGARRLPLAYTLYALVSLAYPLCFPSRYVPLMSYPRFTLTVFPLYIALALFTITRPRSNKVIMAVSIVALIVLTGKFAIFSWVA
jgi:hypothetical protein